jgi:adenylate cyclase
VKVDEEWRAYLLGTHPQIAMGRRMFGWIPSASRCKLCRSPFSGPGRLLMRPMGIVPWEKNPRICRRCVTTMSRHPASGAEIELTLLFADIRGSTGLAERLSAEDFVGLLNRFYAVATEVLIEHDALIDKFVGDEVIGLFIPGVAGEGHAGRATAAARQLLQRTGHAGPDEPWVRVGVGVHTGPARVGLIGGTGGVSDFTALGDSVNTTARLASAAAAGEILISNAAAVRAGGLDPSLETRELTLRGRNEPIRVRVMNVAGRAFETSATNLSSAD